MTRTIAKCGLPLDPDPPKGQWGRGPRYSDEWTTATLEEVPLDELVATEDLPLDPDRLDYYRAGGKAEGEPRVAVEDGVPYLIDGHHRATVALERGERTLLAWVHEG